MLARIRKSQEDEGFTLIELLVVMIIIGILAAIAIPVFLNQRKKAQDSAAKADVSTLGKEIATYYVDNCSVPAVSKVTTAISPSAASATATAGLGVPVGHYALSAPVGTGTCTQPQAYTAVDLGKASDNVTITSAATTIVSDTVWCMGVQNLKGDKQDFKYSATNGLEAGVCS